MSDVVLVTGCSSGIGLETALAFAVRGDRVFATMRDVAKATTLLERAASEGVDVEVLPLDVRSDTSVTAAVTEIRRRAGRIDVLVNNAGVGYSDAVEVMPADTWQAVLDTNLYGPIRTMQAVVGEMRERGSGAIVNIGSAAGAIPGAAFMAFYAASKHGLRAFTESLYAELRAFGVRVRIVQPGFFATEIQNNAAAAVPPASGTTDGPYDAARAVHEAFFAHSAANAPAAAECAAAVVRAVHDPDATVSTLAGDDAVMLATMAHDAGSVEAWTKGMDALVLQVLRPQG